MPIDCTIHCNNNASHLIQLYTGFGLLNKSGVCRVSLDISPKYVTLISGDPVLQVRLRAGHKSLLLVYDMRDGSAIKAEALAVADYYFKRSYSSVIHTDARIMPFGFNYPAYGDEFKDFSVTRLLHDALHVRNIGQLKSCLISACRTSTLISRFLNISSGRLNCHFTAFEALPDLSTANKIILFTRTWDPALARNAAYADERSSMNAMRANCIRKLKDAFGDRFLGGIYRDEYALKNFPDCVVKEQSQTNRKIYLANIRQAPICVATTGLDKSNGWRLAEYIAMSRAIVSEKLHYQVPGNFAAGVNYLEFSDPDSCVAAVDQLTRDYEKRVTLMFNNFNYYNAYMRPDILILNSLKKALGAYV